MLCGGGAGRQISRGSQGDAPARAFWPLASPRAAVRGGGPARPCLTAGESRIVVVRSRWTAATWFRLGGWYALSVGDGTQDLACPGGYDHWVRVVAPGSAISASH